MNAQPNVEDIIQRTRRYEFADGLRDVQLALLFLASGFAVWLAFSPAWLGFVVNMIQRFGRWAAWINLLPLLFAPLAAWGAWRAMLYLRETWLWRESGMVKPARWQVSRRVSLVAALIMIGGLGVGLGLRALGRVDDGFALRMLWAATGWGFGYTLFGIGQDIGLSRYVWVGLIGGLASTVVLLVPLQFGSAALVLGLLWAALLVISGGLALRQAAHARLTRQ